MQNSPQNGRLFPIRTRKGLYATDGGERKHLIKHEVLFSSAQGAGIMGNMLSQRGGKHAERW